MKKVTFTTEQKILIEQLRLLLTKCKESQLKVAGITEYTVFEITDASGRQ